MSVYFCKRLEDPTKTYIVEVNSETDARRMMYNRSSGDDIWFNHKKTLILIAPGFEL